jgi:hypothetical protein
MDEAHRTRYPPSGESTSHAHMFTSPKTHILEGFVLYIQKKTLRTGGKDHEANDHHRTSFTRDSLVFRLVEALPYSIRPKLSCTPHCQFLLVPKLSSVAVSRPKLAANKPT